MAAVICEWISSAEQWHWQEKNEEFGEGSVALSLCSEQKPRGNAAVVYLKQILRKYDMKMLRLDSSGWE